MNTRIATNIAERTRPRRCPYHRPSLPQPFMNNLLRGLIAGYGAKKLGGGCFSTILVFVLIWVVLGQCGATYAPDNLGPTPVEAVSAPVPSADLVPAPVALVPAVD